MDKFTLQHVYVDRRYSGERTFCKRTLIEDTLVNVVKAYLLGEVPSHANLINLPAKQATTNLTAELQASGSGLAATTPATSKAEEQLFTPSTKLIIDEISSDIASKSAKRSLTFSDEDYHCKTTPPTTKPNDTLVSKNKEAAAQRTKESLNKKTKDLIAIKKEIGTHLPHESPSKKTKE